ncbi:MAG TPA: hypothetical protein VMA86_01580, partial [Acetobacteraceae bacterium]|nr:hypothetical protein [Acetobacteraceae bacterium]
ILLILLGLAFREDLSPEHALPTPRTPHGAAPSARCLVPAGTVIVAAALFPILAIGINQAAAATRPAPPTLFASCTKAPAASETVRRFTCREQALTVTLAAFSPRSDPKLVLDTERVLAGQNVPEAETRPLAVPGATPEQWQLVIAGTPPVITASALWIDGAPAQGGLRTRWRQALNSLFGGRYPPLVVALRAEGTPSEAIDRLTSFLASGRIGPAVQRYLDQASFVR